MKNITLFDLYKNGKLCVKALSLALLAQYGLTPTQLENNEYKAIKKQYPFPF